MQILVLSLPMGSFHFTCPQPVKYFSFRSLTQSSCYTAKNSLFPVFAEPEGYFLAKTLALIHQYI